ncbi:uroporphyrinogen-III C-methyltransferase [Microbulbifer halophilus]|uniref:Uroporphyrinogen-III C-methyltransferase n=1 Tax=Microbulbifer halophilus TaxID=453963 RepID=A0ABW5EB82_9GAMM|nr:uroporphyrinogen-III C-methyltransferase [Microbulbifer halophilus]MCW8126667.1 uroporphyrinogen-III C-methyltransferase [Microbulbifer halophilus]
MTDDKSKDTGKSQQATAQDKAEAKSNFAKAAEEKSGKTAKAGKSAPRKKRGGWLWLLLPLALLGAAGTWAWFQWPQARELANRHLDFLPGVPSEETGQPAPRQTTTDAGTRKPETPAAEPEAPAAETQPPTPEPQAPQSGEPPTSPGTAGALEAQERANAALRNQLRRQKRSIAQLQQQLAELQRDVTAQGNRLGELGNIGREDWQLAEADYLLRLANQRLLMERDSRAALGLLEEVDTIVRRVDLPDLYGVRRQLARDITALKLVDNIDRDGIYLRLRALEEQLLRSSIQPEFDLAGSDDGAGDREEAAADASPWQRSLDNFSEFMRDAVRIRDGDIDPVLLSPQSETRYRQSLRLNLEQAQLALMREDTTVYRDALESARRLLLEYGIANNQRDVLARELQELEQTTIEADLPSLAASQSALHNYIERLHKTGGDSPENDDPDSAEAPGSESP